jgi:hypothetical protein
VKKPVKVQPKDRLEGSVVISPKVTPQRLGFFYGSKIRRGYLAAPMAQAARQAL